MARAPKLRLTIDRRDLNAVARAQTELRSSATALACVLVVWGCFIVADVWTRNWVGVLAGAVLAPFVAWWRRDLRRAADGLGRMRWHLEADDES